jgi:RND family efflux transporter MFP subunit
MNEMPRPPKPDAHPHYSGPDQAARARPPRFRGLFLGVIVLLAALLGIGIWTHLTRDQRAAEAQQQQADFQPTIRTTLARSEDKPVKLTLPGTTLAFDQASLYARATGYIAERRVDIGSRVKQGDLLVRIAAPDLDAQLSQAAAQLGQTQAALIQANATVDQARANLKLANVTNYRTSTLANQGWETKQNADTTGASLNTNTANLESALAGVKVAESNFKAQLATVQRLQQLTDYEKVTAPFNGIVTARNVDTGDLVTADANGGTPMFMLQRDDVIRAQTYVPQSGALGLKDGLEAKVTVPEMPTQPFTGHVARTAIALDTASRALLVQVDVENKEGRLHPGTYVDIAFEIPRVRSGVVVPSEAVLFNASGLEVAVIGDDNKVHMRKVSIYRDFGTSVELNDGLQGGERVALSPPIDIHDGETVKPEADK